MLYGVKIIGVAGGAQFLGVGLGERLVFAHEVFGEGDVADKLLLHQFCQRQLGLALGGAAGVHGGDGEVVKRLAAPRAKVENA